MALPLVCGCMGGNPDTLLEELRVVSLVADPPVFDPTVGTTLTAWVHEDDEDAEVEVLIWTCIPGPDGCLEGGSGTATLPLSNFTTVTTPTDQQATFEVAAVPFLADFFSDGGPPMFTWALACEVGLCPVIDQVRDDPQAGTPEWRLAYEFLSDPFTGLESLPLEGTAASFKTLEIGVFDTLPTNPVVTLVSPETLTIASGDRLTLRFEVTADVSVTAFPLATAGGFTETERAVEDGAVEVELVAGVPDSEDAPPVPVGTVIQTYVGFEADDGGSAIWRGEVVVE
jgi:hypothetical protein